MPHQDQNIRLSRVEEALVEIRSSLQHLSQSSSSVQQPSAKSQVKFEKPVSSVIRDDPIAGLSILMWFNQP